MPDIPTLYLVSMFVSGFVAALQYFMSQRMCRLPLRLWALSNLALCIGHLLFLVRPMFSFAVATTISNTILMTGVALMAAGMDAFAGRRLRLVEVVIGPAFLMVGFSLSFWMDVSNSGRLLITTAPLVYYLLRASATLLRLASHRNTTAVRIFCAATLTGFAGLYVLRALGAVAGLAGAGDVITNAGGSLIRASILFVILIWNFCTLYLVQEREAATDPLTGLFNRGATVASGESLVGRARTGGEPISLLLLDLDRFKSVNDRFGHAMGDQVLRIFAGVMGRSVRRNDVIGRIGGEEFCILLPECDADAARVLAERLRIRCLEALARVDDQPVATTVSIGVATGTTGSFTFETLLKDADTALYAAKASGRNRVCMAPATIAGPAAAAARHR